MSIQEFIKKVIKKVYGRIYAIVMNYKLKAIQVFKKIYG